MSKRNHTQQALQVVPKPVRLTPQQMNQIVMSLQEQLQNAQAQLTEARRRFALFNEAVCGLLLEKFKGRTFVTVPSFSAAEGFTVDVFPQKALGNIRLTCIDGNGKERFTDDGVIGPKDVVCGVKDCGTKAIFATGKEKDGRPINPRCGAHLPDGAQVIPDRPIEAVVPDEPVVVCEGCGRKVGHNRDCKFFGKD